MLHISDNDYQAIANDISEQTEGYLEKHFDVEYKKGSDILYIHGYVGRYTVKAEGGVYSDYKVEIMHETACKHLNISDVEAYNKNYEIIESNFSKYALIAAF